VGKQQDALLSDWITLPQIPSRFLERNAELHCMRRIAANIAKLPELSWNQQALYQQKARSDEGLIEFCGSDF
jgi:hypothetical protein